MELEQEGGNSLSLEVGSPTLIGRELGLGFSSSDLTISRRHVSLQLMHAKDDSNDECEELLLQFEVIGKNPILVCRRGGGGKRVFRKSEKGVLKAGDCISLSIKIPVLYAVKLREGGKVEVDSSVLDAVERRERRTRQRRKEAEERAKLDEDRRGDDEAFREGSELEFGSLEISEIDPVKEFGFLVRGHEFDQYPRRSIRPFKNWNWFLEDTGGGSGGGNEEDEVVGTKLKGRRRKKNNDDEDWTEEIDNEKTLAAKAGNAKRPRYSTRLKDPKKLCSVTQGRKRPADKELNSQQNEVEDEDDETLGGFIAGDDDFEEEEVEVLEDESEEEEEFEDEDESDVD